MQGESAVAGLAHLNLSEILPIGQAIEKFNPDSALKISVSRSITLSLYPTHIFHSRLYIPTAPWRVSLSLLHLEDFDLRLNSSGLLPKCLRSSEYLKA
jgi:hypothetical protein